LGQRFTATTTELVGQQNGKFVAAEASHEVGRSHRTLLSPVAQAENCRRPTRHDQPPRPGAASSVTSARR
jgi:hypothetical protein